MSVRAARLSLLGANQRLPYQWRMESRTCVLADLHRQQTFRAEGFLDFLVGHQRGRAAEIAALADARRRSKTEMAWQLWHLTEVLFACQPRCGIGDAAQRRHQVVLDDDLLARGGEFRLRGRGGAAERADERLSWRDSIAPRRRRTGRRIFFGRWLQASALAEMPAQTFKNSSRAALGTRQVEPIFLPLRSPFSSVASTSASLTPRILATSAEPSNSGVRAAAAAE